MHTMIHKTDTAQEGKRLIIIPSMLLAVLIGAASVIGIFTDDFYGRESVNWQLQSGGQDVMNLLLIVPLLVICATSVHLNRNVASVLWAGTTLYAVYTFTIYCFDVHFNRMFPLYCLILCISIYSLLYFLYYYLERSLSHKTIALYPWRFTGIYFILIAILFAMLWWSEILPAIITDSMPVNLALINLPTNPVHVLDLSFILPGIFLTGILLLRKERVGFLLAPIFLVFFILMDISIALLTMILKTQGQDGSFTMAGMMVGLSFASLWFLVQGMRVLFNEVK